jgi:hypothetical protein
MSAQLTHEKTQARTAEPVISAVRGRLRRARDRVRMTLAEMSYAAWRVVELQAPWSIDKQWHSRQR